MSSIWIFIQLVLCLILLFPLLLVAVSAIRKTFIHNRTITGVNYDYAVIITAYQQVDYIPDVVNSILNCDYSNYLIYVVADNCDISSLSFTDERVVILRPEKVLSSNVKSHYYAIDHFKREHNAITIIDSDNIVSANYLTQMSQVFNRGYKAVQGIRAARNLDTIYACLDEAGDIYYRFIDRKLLFEAGSSASLAGSGMGFLTKTYIECMKNFNQEGAGFDKFLQYELVRKNEIIAFSENTIVYDGKTSKSDQLVKQRARWINTWFKYWVLGIRLLLKSVFNLNWNQFAFSLMLLRPPLFLLLILVGFVVCVNLFLAPAFILLWALALIFFVIIFFTALRYFNADKRIYNALIHIPKFIFYQIKAFFKARSANKISVATKHDLTSHRK